MEEPQDQQPPATNDFVAPGAELFTEAVDPNPTIEQAKAMFKERPDLASVLTTDGLLHRTGELT